MHFLVFVSFTVLVFTGMPLKFKTSPWAQWVMNAFGGVTAAGVYHRIAAVITLFYWSAEMIYMIVMVARSRGKAITGPGSMMFKKRDLTDLVGMFAWFLGKGPKPQFDRYMYLEKFDYMSLVAGTVIIGGTGLMMWFPMQVTKVLPGQFLNVALVIHSNEALLAMGVIFIFVHFFSAHLKPESFPLDKVIFTGSMPVEHYAAERPLEYARRVREGTLDQVLVVRTVTWRTHVADVVWWTITAIAGISAVAHDGLHRLVDLHMRSLRCRAAAGGREVRSMKPSHRHVMVTALLLLVLCAGALAAFTLHVAPALALPLRIVHAQRYVQLLSSRRQHGHAAHRRRLHWLSRRLQERARYHLLELPRTGSGHLDPGLAGHGLQPELPPLRCRHRRLRHRLHARRHAAPGRLGLRQDLPGLPQHQHQRQSRRAPARTTAASPCRRPRAPTATTAPWPRRRSHTTA